MTAVRITGGCQCGAVRYALHEQPTNPHICHCRMCQKAFGNFFAALVQIPTARFELTRGTLGIFMSSARTERGFCRDCGTPLMMREVDDPRMFVSTGSLDAPADIAPKRQYGIEARMPYFADLPSLPGDKTTEEHDPASAAAIAASNRQHPDHDTENWPPRGLRNA